MFSPSAPAAPPPLVRQSFEKDTQGWTAIGASAVVRRADLPVAADSPAGSGLLFEYRIDPGTVDALTLGVEAGSWSLAQRVSFQVQAASRTTLILSVQEKQGGRWSAVVHCSGPGWQRVRLDAGDFQLSRDAGAPVDPDERLDFGAVEQVVLVDFAVMAVRAEGPLRALFPATAGQRRLWLRDFTVEPGSRDVDGLAAPQLGWLPIGGAVVAKVEASESPLPGTSLKATLSVGPGKVAGILRPLPESMLAGARGLRMRFASSDSLALLLLIEDAAGGKFTKTIELPGEKLLRSFDIGFEDLTKADDSKTERLDTRRIRQILLLDASGTTEGGERVRTVWTMGWEPR